MCIFSVMYVVFGISIDKLKSDFPRCIELFEGYNCVCVCVCVCWTRSQMTLVLPLLNEFIEVISLPYESIFSNLYNGDTTFCLSGPTKLS